MTTVRTVAEAAAAELKQTTVPAKKVPLREQIDLWKRVASGYDSEPETQEGRKELATRAKAAEAKRVHAMAAYHHELASAALQIAIVQASAEIITGVAALTWWLAGSASLVRPSA
jgi:hypothetical protein